jgi:hypothetical protein
VQRRELRRRFDLRSRHLLHTAAAGRLRRSVLSEHLWRRPRVYCCRRTWHVHVDAVNPSSGCHRRTPSNDSSYHVRLHRGGGCTKPWLRSLLRGRHRPPNPFFLDPSTFGIPLTPRSRRWFVRRPLAPHPALDRVQPGPPTPDRRAVWSRAVPRGASDTRQSPRATPRTGQSAPESRRAKSRSGRPGSGLRRRIPGTHPSRTSSTAVARDE